MYERFCSIHRLRAFPPTESSFLRFIAYLNILNLRSQTIKVYVAGLDHHCVLHDWNRSASFQRVKLLLRAVTMVDIPRKGKLPITLDILNIMKPLVISDSEDGYMFWAAMVLAHFGLLRVSEFTVNTKFDAAIHVSGNSVTLEEKRVSIFVPRSKTDKYHKGFTLSFVCNKTSVCPFCALKFYYMRSFASKNFDLPLFRLSNGKPLTRSVFVKETKRVLQSLGMDVKNYSSHSFRAGGATSAAQSGFKDWELKQLGRWKSNCYQCYIRPSDHFLETLRNKISTSVVDRDLYNFQW